MMRVLLDENLPRKLKGCFLSEVEVVTVPERYVEMGSVVNYPMDNLRLTPLLPTDPIITNS